MLSKVTIQAMPEELRYCMPNDQEMGFIYECFVNLISIVGLLQCIIFDNTVDICRYLKEINKQRLNSSFMNLVQKIQLLESKSSYVAEIKVILVSSRANAL